MNKRNKSFIVFLLMETIICLIFLLLAFHGKEAEGTRCVLDSVAFSSREAAEAFSKVLVDAEVKTSIRTETKTSLQRGRYRGTSVEECSQVTREYVDLVKYKGNFYEVSSRGSKKNGASEKLNEKLYLASLPIRFKAGIFYFKILFGIYFFSVSVGTSPLYLR